MDLKFSDRATGWKPRGRPPRQVPAQILNLLIRTYDTDTIGSIAIEPADTPDEIRETLGLLRSGARQLGKHLRLQRDPTEIRFFVTDTPLPRGAKP